MYISSKGCKCASKNLVIPTFFLIWVILPYLQKRGTVPTSRKFAIPSYQILIFDGSILTLCSSNIICDSSFLTFDGSLTFFLIFDVSILTLCGSNITYDSSFLTFSGSLTFFSRLTVPSSHYAFPTSHMTILFSYLVVLLLFSHIWWFHPHIVKFQHHMW